MATTAELQKRITSIQENSSKNTPFNGKNAQQVSINIFGEKRNDFIESLAKLLVLFRELKGFNAAYQEVHDGNILENFSHEKIENLDNHCSDARTWIHTINTNLSPSNKNQESGKKLLAFLANLENLISFFDYRKNNLTKINKKRTKTPKPYIFTTITGNPHHELLGD